MKTIKEFLKEGRGSTVTREFVNTLTSLRDVVEKITGKSYEAVKVTGIGKADSILQGILEKVKKPKWEGLVKEFSDVTNEKEMNTILKKWFKTKG